MEKTRLKNPLAAEHTGTQLGKPSSVAILAQAILAEAMYPRRLAPNGLRLLRVYPMPVCKKFTSFVGGTVAIVMVLFMVQTKNVVERLAGFQSRRSAPSRGQTGGSGREKWQWRVKSGFCCGAQFGTQCRQRSGCLSNIIGIRTDKKAGCMSKDSGATVTIDMNSATGSSDGKCPTCFIFTNADSHNELVNLQRCSSARIDVNSSPTVINEQVQEYVFINADDNNDIRVQGYTGPSAVGRWYDTDEEDYQVAYCFETSPSLTGSYIDILHWPDNSDNQS